jgi:Mn2+/Fe2+ NRAMP family transporter
MTERELGKALLKLDVADLSGVPDARALAWQVIEHDRRRVRALAWGTIAVWLLSVALILGVLVFYALLFPKQAKLRMDAEQGRVTAAEQRQAEEEHRIAFQMGTVLIAFGVAVLAAAALCTVLLALAARRATLRQINASLLEITEQLRQLRAAGGSG